MFALQQYIRGETNPTADQPFFSKMFSDLKYILSCFYCKGALLKIGGIPRNAQSLPKEKENADEHDSAQNEKNLDCHCFTPTRLAGFPSANALMLPRVVSKMRRRASQVLNALCGVIMTLGISKSI